MVRERARQVVIGRDKDEGDFQYGKPLGDGKAVFMTQADIEEREIRRTDGDHGKCARNVQRGPRAFHAETENRLLKIKRDEGIVLDDQDVIGQGSHCLSAASRIGGQRRDISGIESTPRRLAKMGRSHRLR